MARAPALRRIRAACGRLRRPRPSCCGLLGRGGSRGRVKTDAVASVAYLARQPLLIASSLLALVALMAFWPSAWGRRVVLAVAMLEVFFSLQPFRINYADPQTITAEAGSLTDF